MPIEKSYGVRQSYRSSENVTPSDTTDLPSGPCSALYVGNQGHLEVIMAGGENVTYYNAPVGVFPIQVRRVLYSGTTAQNIIALY